MDELVVWLRAQLDEDERIARATEWDGSGNRLSWELAASATIDVGEDEFYAGDRTIANHVVEHDPARVLREIDAKRQLLAVHELTFTEALMGEQFDLNGVRLPPDLDVTCKVCGPVHRLPAYACATVCLLALPYADRPGYREEWRP
ncbi:DUF6221 family protein [Streptomyces sp. SudanB91_2054]|uniref:DUF6221 family protein n=1 Tax=Streptomyces sp. SudanB91_2054 TaxID=3035278 RepID=UPI0036DF1385